MRYLSKLFALLTVASVLFSLFSCDKEPEMEDFGEYESDGEYVVFGRYQQSLAPYEIEITEESGGYVFSRGDTFVRGYASQSYKSSGYQWYKADEDDEDSWAYFGDETLYFKVEPLRWKIIKKEENRMLLWCEDVIDMVPFDASLNGTYEDGNIREWLNGTFKEKAFSSAEREIIMPTKTGVGEGDSVFILTQEDFERYGIEDRRKLLSSYALINYQIIRERRKYGVSQYSYKNMLGSYWTMTNGGRSVAVNCEGDFEPYYPNVDKIGIAPAVWIFTANK